MAKLYFATVTSVVAASGVAQWWLNPDIALVAVGCAFLSIVPCLIHWVILGRVSKVVLQAVLFWGPILLFIALWVWGQTVPNNEGQHEVTGLLIVYTSLPWCCTSVVLLVVGSVLKDAGDESLNHDSLNSSGEGGLGDPSIDEQGHWVAK